MMDVVDEEMREQVADPLRDRCPSSPRSVATRLSRSAASSASQKATSRRSKRLCASASSTGSAMVDEAVEQCQPFAALLQHVEVVEVDRQDVIQRCLDRGKEARARRGELAGTKRKHGAIEAIVRPEIVAGHPPEIRQRGQFAPPRAGRRPALSSEGFTARHVPDRTFRRAARSRRKSNARSGPSSRCAPCRRMRRNGVFGRAVSDRLDHAQFGEAGIAGAAFRHRFARPAVELVGHGARTDDGAGGKRPRLRRMGDQLSEIESHVDAGIGAAERLAVEVDAEAAGGPCRHPRRRPVRQASRRPAKRPTTASTGRSRNPWRVRGAVSAAQGDVVDQHHQPDRLPAPRRAWRPSARRRRRPRPRLPCRCPGLVGREDRIERGSRKQSEPPW